MGTRIKGITIELNGDATGLDKALRGIDKQLRQTESSLKDVNRLLKLDPGNTELLRQKQELLQKSIKDTKERLDALKEADKQAKVQLEAGTLGQEKYDALQREIVETEQELKRLQEIAVESRSVLVKIGEAGERLESVGDSIAGTGKKLSGVTTVIGGVGVAAVKTAADFDSAMSQVAAVSGASGEAFQALRDKAREMGEKTKFSASEAAEAMNYMAMAGWKTEDMLSGIEGIMNLAAASGEDLATTSDIVTDALTALGLTAADSGHFADILAAASSNANTNVRMMGETFKYCAPVAGALGYTAEDTAEAIGLMANAGIKSSQAGTAMRTMMTSLNGEVTFVGDAFGKLTVQTAKTDGSMRSLGDILADCRGAFAQMSESEKASNAEALVGKNAMSGFLAVMNAAPGDIEKLNSAINNCGGTAEKMSETMQDNLNGQITILMSKVQELAISFGEILVPAVRNIVERVQAFTDKLNGMDEGTKKSIAKIALLVAAIGPFLVIIGTVISKVGTAMKGFVGFANGIGKVLVKVNEASGVFGKLGAALGGISAPVMAIVAVIGTLVAAFVHLWNTNKEFRDNISAIWERIKSIFTGFVEGIQDRLSALGISFENITGAIKTVWEGFCDMLAPLFEGAFGAVATILEMVTGILTGILDVFIGVATGNWQQAWEGIKSIFQSAWDGIIELLTEVFGTLTGMLDVVYGWFGTSWEEAWNDILNNPVVSIIAETVMNLFGNVQETLSGIWEGIKEAASAAWELIKNLILGPILLLIDLATGDFEKFRKDVLNIWNNIKDAAGKIWDGIKEMVGSLVEGLVKNAIKGFKNMVDGIQSSIKNIGGIVKEGFNSAIEFITSLPSQAMQWGSDFINGLKEGIMSGVQGIVDTVKGVADGIRSFLHFSRPDRGPLREYEKWMPDFMKGLEEGIISNTERIRKAVGNVAETMVLDLQPVVQYGSREPDGDKPKGSGGTGLGQSQEPQILQNINVNQPCKSPVEMGREMKRIGKELAFAEE